MAVDKVKKLIDEILVKEGGYSNNPADSGGETNWGITRDVARAFGYTGDMKTLPKTTAREIYEKQYIINPGFVKIKNAAIQLEIVDCGVNMGTSTATKFLQIALNALCDKNLSLDGRFGKDTNDALDEYLSSRENAESILLKALNCLQGARYIEIANTIPKNRKFINGWIANRIEL